LHGFRRGVPHGPVKDSPIAPSPTAMDSNSSNSANSTPTPTSKGCRWLQRLGWAGFMFFLIKGLVWLAVFYGMGRMVGLD